jgi:hypothetical protein
LHSGSDLGWLASCYGCAGVVDLDRNPNLRNKNDAVFAWKVEEEMKRILMLALLLVAMSAQARDPAQVRSFRKVNPCPSTGKTSGACPGFVVDHLWPLCAGGEDSPKNMAWQPVDESYEKDKSERDLCRRLKECAK